MVELSCGVSVAMCYNGRLTRTLGRQLHPDEKVVIVICGGSNISVNLLEKWRRAFGNMKNKTEEVSI